MLACIVVLIDAGCQFVTIMISQSGTEILLFHVNVPHGRMEISSGGYISTWYVGPNHETYSPEKHQPNQGGGP